MARNKIPGYLEMPLASLVKSEPVRSGKRHVIVSHDYDVEGDPRSRDSGPPTLQKSLINILDGNSKKSIERLAFEADPTLNNQYASIYKQKVRLIPDNILKRIAIQDDLVACIVQARSAHVAAFGRPREDRFGTGYVIEPKEGIRDRANFDESKKEELQRRIDKAIKVLATCGNTTGWQDKDKMSFSTYLSMSVRNALVVGRLATEIIWVQDLNGGKKFHSFRPIDAGTIYRAAPQKSAAESVRRNALTVLEQIKNKKLVPEKVMNDDYAWIQVIESRPVQAFTEDECVVHNFYPVPDIELDGYPVTPIDTMIAQVTMHINIVTHNKLYFQSGRATRGMLVIQSDDVDETTIQRLRQQFNASINNVSNAWRMPVFGIGPDDTLTWEPIDNSGQRDMEFQYLTDMNARSILSAFQMSPEELPGWAYLSRGTNNQAMSESNNEYRLEAHRDLGIRPLLKQFEDFVNSVLFPLIDPTLADVAVFKLVGLDAETAEKEAVRIEQDAPIHLTQNEILEKVEKKPIDKEMGGDFPLSPMYTAILDKYIPVGKVLEYFFGVKGASKDPQWAYVRDPFWFQFVQMQQQAQAMQQQQQMQQQQAAAGGPPQGGGDAGGGGGGGDASPPPPSGDQAQPGGASSDQSGGSPSQPYGNVPTEKEKSSQASQSSGQGQDLSRALDQALEALSKSEKQLPASRKKLLAQHRKTVDHVISGMMEDMKSTTKDVLRVAEHFVQK